MGFENDAARSLRLFQKFSVHAMTKCFVGSQVVPIEGREDDATKLLDRLAGLDGLIVNGNGTIDFYSSRVQVGKNYETFSLRRSRANGMKTEFAKLQQARRTGGAMPQFMIQAFVDSDEKSATVAIAPMIDVLDFAEHNPEIRATPTGETFFVVPWFALARVKIYRVDASGYVEKLPPLSRRLEKENAK